MTCGLLVWKPVYKARELDGPLLMIIDKGVYCRAARVRLDHDGPDSGLEQGGLPFAVKYIGFEEPSVSLPDALLFLKNESQSIYSNRTLQTEDIASTTVDRVLEFLSDASQDDYRSVAIRPDSWIPEVQSTLHFDPEKIAAHKVHELTKSVMIQSNF